VAAQLVQAAAAARPGAAGRDAQPGADLGIRQRRILDEQGEQLLAARGQLPECLPQGGVPLGREQVLPGCLGVIVGDGPGGQRIPGVARAPGRARGPGSRPWLLLVVVWR